MQEHAVIDPVSRNNTPHDAVSRNKHIIAHMPAPVSTTARVTITTAPKTADALADVIEKIILPVTTTAPPATTTAPPAAAAVTGTIIGRPLTRYLVTHALTSPKLICTCILNYATQYNLRCRIEK